MSRTSSSERRRLRAARACCLGLLAAVVVACSSTREGSPTTGQVTTTASTPMPSAPAASFPVTVEHAFGATTIEREPQRIVALGDGSQDVVAALGLTPVGIPSGYGGSNANGVLPWFEPFFDPARTTLLPVFDGLPFEAIAALDPDVILAPYAGFDESGYGLLSAIAPTIAYPDEPWSTPWQVQTEMIGAALGRPAQAAALVAEVERGLASTAAEHPSFDGLTFTYLYTDAANVFVYLPADSRVQLVSALGLVPSPGVAALAAAQPDAFTTELSPERLSEVDADVVIIEQADGSADASRVPGIDQLGAFAADRVIAYGTDDAALSTALIPTVLSIPWAVERLAKDLADAVGPS